MGSLCVLPNLITPFLSLLSPELGASQNRVSWPIFLYIPLNSYLVFLAFEFIEMNWIFIFPCDLHFYSMTCCWNSFMLVHSFLLLYVELPLYKLYHDLFILISSERLNCFHFSAAINALKDSLVHMGKNFSKVYT